jgi:hypothetical protein
MEETSSLFVGGEFYYDNQWKADKPTFPVEGLTFLNGGKACLTIICDYLRDHDITSVLLPAYLCPTIVDTIESGGLNCDYYNVFPNFSIDTNDLHQHLTNGQALYFINYFGFAPSDFVLKFLNELRQDGRVVIEDNAQAGFLTHTSGDLAFNSMRKLCPYDGGYLKTSQDIQPYRAAYAGRENRRLPLIRQYRRGLHEYLFEEEGDHAKLEALYEMAERYYASDLVVLGDEKERQNIELLDWSGIKQARRKNYSILLQLISGNSLITPVFSALQPDNMPLGLPVYVRGDQRDKLNEYLGENGIGLTIHWEDLATDPRLNSNLLAVQMAKNILTLTVDQYTNQEQLEFLAQKLADFE